LSRKTKISLNKSLRDETGQILVLVLPISSVAFNSQNDFYGSIGVNTNFELQTNSPPAWTSPSGNLNMPGIGGHTTGDFGSNVTKYTCKIS
jgi:hypothetical protein